MRFIVLALLVFVLTACQAATPDPSVIQAAVVLTQAALPTASPYPTYTPPATFTPLPALPTLTPYSTYTPAPTQTPLVIIVTATSSPTPLYTSTITQTPTKTLVPSFTPSPLQKDKGTGLYLVNIDIAPGIWRNNGTGSQCYWKRSTRTGDIISNHFGLAGGTMYIATSDFQVELGQFCGRWTYIGQP